MRASVSLLSQLSDKLLDYCRADFMVANHPLSSEEMGEFYYALGKARAFEQMSAKRPASKLSGDAFSQLVDAYEKFVHDADQYRINPAHTHEQLEKLINDHAAVKQYAHEVRDALAQE